MKVFACGLIPLLVSAHGDDFPINPDLGVPGFPDCVRSHPDLKLGVEEAADDLVCMQKDAPGAIRIGMIGDSITAGVCSSGGNHPYPQQVQILLDQAYGEGVYSVTNLGACGSTMLKNANSPYWKRGQYTTLTSNEWDIITIMLGTNDAKDPDSHGPDNWQHDCSAPDASAHIEGCTFADDYKSMVEVVRTLGRNGSVPKVYGLIPPPLMQQFSIGANQSVINSVYPNLVPLIAKDNNLDGVIDVFTGMGGVTNWQDVFPDKCVKSSPWAPCAYWCDDQHCDQCHPNDNGYAHLATIVQEGLGLMGPAVIAV